MSTKRSKLACSYFRYGCIGSTCGDGGRRHPPADSGASVTAENLAAELTVLDTSGTAEVASALHTDLVTANVSVNANVVAIFRSHLFSCVRMSKLASAVSIVHFLISCVRMQQACHRHAIILKRGTLAFSQVWGVQYF